MKNGQLEIIDETLNDSIIRKQDQINEIKQFNQKADYASQDVFGQNFIDQVSSPRENKQMYYLNSNKPGSAYTNRLIRHK